MTALRADGLVVRLGRRTVLAGIALAFEPARFTVLVGPNGAGKTTLLRALAGLVRPASGTVTLDGARVDHLAGRERARLISFLPQAGSIAWPLPVADVVALGRFPHGEEPGALSAAGRAAVAEALRELDLVALRSRPASELSGGERARVLLARALATRAPVLLADEPAAALDLRHQLGVLELLRGRARAGATIVAVMHDLGLAARFADRIVVLDDGAVRAAGAPAEVLTAERLAATFQVTAEVFRGAGRLTIWPVAPLTIDELRNSS